MTETRHWYFLRMGFYSRRYGLLHGMLMIMMVEDGCIFVLLLAAYGEDAGRDCFFGWDGCVVGQGSIYGWCGLLVGISDRSLEFGLIRWLFWDLCFCIRDVRKVRNWVMFAGFMDSKGWFMRDCHQSPFSIRGSSGRFGEALGLTSCSYVFMVLLLQSWLPLPTLEWNKDTGDPYSIYSCSILYCRDTSVQY